MPYQHRPLSKILAETPDLPAEGQNTEDQPRDSETGQFVSPATENKQESILPEKYKGKTTEEIAEMHMNAEKELGRVRNEVGTYRGLVNDLTNLQRKAPEPQNVDQEKVDVSGDDILLDPAGAIDKVVTQRLQERDEAEAVSRAQAEKDLEGQRLVTDFPDLDTIVASREFQEFAHRTSARQQDLVTAAQGEGFEQVQAARRLLEDFTDFRDSMAPQQAPNTVQSRPVNPTPDPGVQAAAAVSTEGAGPSGAVSTKPLIYETDVIKLIQSDPGKYRSPSFQGELMTAMREGRYVKSS
jgi:hypothetical protein